MSQPVRQLSDLLEGIPCRILAGTAQCAIQGVVTDSQHVLPDVLFVAVRGLHTDGHRFLEEALDKGATALVVEELPPQLIHRVQQEGQTVVQVSHSRRALALIACAYYQWPSRRLNLVGITGTNGKTTTSYVVEAIVRAAGGVPGVLGTVEYRFAGQHLAAPHTTPEASLLQSLLWQMSQQGVSHAVMEVSSHALDQERVVGCDFAVCVFTNLSRDHYDYHGSEEAYFAAKARLFLEPLAQWHVLNLDDPYSQKLLQASRARLLTYGLEAEATLQPQAVQHGLDGIRFTLATTKGQLDIRSRLVGRHNVYNLLAGIAVGIALDLDADAIINGIAQLQQVPGRLERIDQGQDFYVFVDYAHTPVALEQVFHFVRAETSGRFIAVFGCGGDRDPGKRALMGQVATALSDYTVITSDNPRTEEPQRIIDDIVAGVDTSRAYATISDRRQAIAYAIDIAQPQDTVLIAGKGHEDYQIIGHTRRHFDDREVAREVLNNRR